MSPTPVKTTETDAKKITCFCKACKKSMILFDTIDRAKTPVWYCQNKKCEEYQVFKF